MKYRKKPVVVDAEIYRVGMEDGFEYEDLMPEEVDIRKLYKYINVVAMYPYINTLEGRHYIGEGDYIITGIKGERYPCKPDIFAATYEPVGEAPQMTEQERYKQFAKDMEEAGRDVEEYAGRNFYNGPAVRIESNELQDVIRETKIKLQWDTLGRDGLIVYPW